MSRNDLSAIGKIKSLVKLNMNGCKIESGSISHLQGLNNLRKLYVDKIEGLSNDDVLRIGSIGWPIRLDVCGLPNRLNIL